jgi:hypothetical protein
VPQRPSSLGPQPRTPTLGLTLTLAGHRVKYHAAPGSHARIVGERQMQLAIKSGGPIEGGMKVFNTFKVYKVSRSAWPSTVNLPDPTLIWSSSPQHATLTGLTLPLSLFRPQTPYTKMNQILTTIWRQH